MHLHIRLIYVIGQNEFITVDSGFSELHLGKNLNPWFIKTPGCNLETKCYPAALKNTKKLRKRHDWEP